MRLYTILAAVALSLAPATIAAKDAKPTLEQKLSVPQGSPAGKIETGGMTNPSYLSDRAKQKPAQKKPDLLGLSPLKAIFGDRAGYEQSATEATGYKSRHSDELVIGKPLAPFAPAKPGERYWGMGKIDTGGGRGTGYVSGHSDKLVIPQPVKVR